MESRIYEHLNMPEYGSHLDGQMKELLHRLPKPSHYAGIEDGVWIKNPDNVTLRIALAFPDTYEVGMSYLGHKILYDIINTNPHWWAERVMAPDREAAEILRTHNVPLCTLESDTPLGQLHAIGFAITHELCFTDVLHMLDLSGIPLRSKARGDDISRWPIIMAGGGAMMGAEALTPFLDLVFLGDGEEQAPETLEILERAISENWSKKQFLMTASKIQGVYIPSFFRHDENGRIHPLVQGYRPARRIVADMAKASYPLRQVLPAGAVHNRLTLEIARGCTRGCRFCHAGMVYRPARERHPDQIGNIAKQCLANTGFEELSFLSLSVGDYSAFRTLWKDTFAYCHNNQVSLSLPSLRAGSVDDGIMADMATLRRTGCTIAPEAGSQRLRDVINKGITDEDIISHAKKLAGHGWRQIKLYFMIGLPTETDADLEAIADLCARVRDAGLGQGAKLRVACAISPFVPKPFTPFQWEAQIPQPEIERRLNILTGIFRSLKNCFLKWHDPASSFLEGLLSRADRRLADVVEKAYHNGAKYCAWTESFDLAPWLLALEECGLNAEEFTGGRTPGQYLPWSHLEAGISEKFLLREREMAMAGTATPDCRYNACNNCGACGISRKTSLLTCGQDDIKISNILVFTNRDQKGEAQEQSLPASRPACPTLPGLAPKLGVKAAHYRIWHTRLNAAAYLSQLELQAIILRYLRRSGLPLAFSRGFHPLPLLSFGKALPVGIESEAEWFSITLNEARTPDSIMAGLAGVFPKHLRVLHVEEVEKSGKTIQAAKEVFAIRAQPGFITDIERSFADFTAKINVSCMRKTKKGVKEENLRPYLESWQRPKKDELAFCADWTKGYISPLVLVKTILGAFGADVLSFAKIVKTDQIFQNGNARANFPGSPPLI